MNLAKPKRITNRAYLRWIKTLECVVAGNESFPKTECLGPIDPHHSIPVSVGGSDYTAVPICRKHHGMYQSSATARLIFLDFAASLRRLHIQKHPDGRGPRSEQKIKPYKKRLVHRGWGLIVNGSLAFPIVSSLWEAKQLRDRHLERVVRVQIRVEGTK